jgi:phosphate transport system permease protein
MSIEFSKAKPMTLGGSLPRFFTPGAVILALTVGYLASSSAARAASAEINYFAFALLSFLVFILISFSSSFAVEGARKAKDRFVTTLVTSSFLVALVPLASLVITVVSLGIKRFDFEFFSFSMRNILGPGGGAIHAIVGTLEITLIATIISVPIGILTAIYLVEYGRGRLAKAVTFFVDVMTGIPSIVAGLFAYAVFALLFGPGVRMGIAGSVALSVLMIPVVIRSTEEMLKIVPNELREASYALGVPKWLTILKVVIPTSLAGIVTGVMIAIARVIGETAPLLLVAGFTSSMNYNPLEGRMMTLPVFVYTSYANVGTDFQAYIDRAWAGALTLMLIVMILNLAARVIAKIFSPTKG